MNRFLLAILSTLIFCFLFSGCGLPGFLTFADFNDTFAIETQVMKKDGSSIENLAEEISSSYKISVKSIEYTVPTLDFKFTSRVTVSDPEAIKLTLNPSDPKTFAPTDFVSPSLALPIEMSISFEDNMSYCNKEAIDEGCEVFGNHIDSYLEIITAKAKQILTENLVLKISGIDTQTFSTVAIEIHPDQVDFDCHLVESPIAPDPSVDDYSFLVDFNGTLQCFSSAVFIIN